MPEPIIPARTSARPALLLMLFFWLFYFAINTFRAWLFDSPGQVQMVGNRLVVMAAGFLLTTILWQILRRSEGFSTRRLVITAFIAALPIAACYAIANHLMFYIVSPIDKAMEEMAHMGKQPDPPWKIIVDQALSWYFFIVAWAMLYIALSYAERVRGAERQMAALRTAAQTAELRALRYQVNPHFLFNTLNSLSSLIMARRHEQAERMILNLSDFFRASLTGDPSHDVPLADEIALQQLYLAVEQERFPNRLSVTIDLPHELRDMLVPGLILQPLVENAVRHGVSRTPDSVRVRIGAARDGDRLVLTVEDDARGEGSRHDGHGMGIRNVCERLKARFGEQGSCTHGALPGEGYRCTLMMPAAHA